ncbi:uncharacterized protein BT62DRAFT_951706 [Guyanagaster necrorhizus]|uniref:Uncharacterized protein n=1 Tax=Guyanagaster necrorhizus TaxID=856835 RepID=A0A9P8AR52_9AGAR|nr:uncharacterized protein BT62DRAFT_951706 [Guyanagaster necrorhizus MCA 3950]KAG7444695.1 hypothetical protein BT62DRAFT_951706 [Guyanagaster necrorhizus MCA 3950]
MPLPPTAPSIDVQNPLYCPAVPAASFLNALRTQLNLPMRPLRNSCRKGRRVGSRFDPKVVVSSFTRLLGKALLQDSSPQNMVLRTIKPRSRNYNVDSGFVQLPWDISGSSSSKDTPPRPALKRKLSDDFPEILHGPAKHVKSFVAFSASEDSNREDDERVEFVPLDLCRTWDSDTSPVKIQEPVEKAAAVSVEDQLVDRVRMLEDLLYGPPIGPESPRGLSILIDRLDTLLPGIRLKERLGALQNKSHQGITDYLGEHGLLNSRIISILRTSEIRNLWLGNSLADEDGLNIDGRDVFSVFSKPNSFLFLSFLSLVGTLVHDFDLVHIQRLPRLAALHLSNTGIGNEAVYIIISLKRTLTHLSVATNPDIDNDAIPALLLLSRLSFLSIQDTSIDMAGLRRLAHVINHEGRIIDVEIPETCEHYIDNLHEKYLIDIQPPLIHRASLCSQLSGAALKRNLVAHATCNPTILAAGTKAEMKERLEGILKVREMDILVNAMISA